MLLNVSQLLMEASGSVREYQMDERIGLLDSSREDLVSGEVKLLKTTRSVWVSASFNSDVVNECDRCLAPFSQSVHMDIEEEYFPALDPATGDRTQPEDADEDTLYIDENQMLDLTPMVQEYASLDLPMKPLCKSDCAGLCPNCGVNLNDAACQCDTTPRDPRWGALLDMVSNVSQDD
ncbi:MAG: DUF177 domain-containing protein [SAR202 cluster bacterium]|jgi:uncharacterized protein|nr:DUF177 domain-containing protein [SAR202 cluster bacterium]